jgi:hypothetical protein
VNVLEAPGVRSAGPTGGVHALRAVLVVAILEVPLLVGVFWGVHVGLWVAIAAAPFVTFALLHARGREVGLPVLPGLFVSAAFGLFFGAGAMAWALAGPNPSLGAGIAAESATWLMAFLGLVTIAIVVGERIGMRSAPQLVPLQRGSLFAIGQALFLASVLGVLLTVKHMQGWHPAAEALRSHDKEQLAAAAQTIGLSFWSIFALPACVALGIVALHRGWGGTARAVAAVQLSALAIVAGGLFGSRLLLTLAAIAIAGATYGAGGRRMRLRTVGAAIVVFLAISSAILVSREGAHNSPGQDAVVAQLRTLGYGMFDVSLAVWAERETLGAAYREVGRVQPIASLSLPFVGRRATDISEIRYDVMTARVIGGAAHVDRSGFPPSFPTAAVVAVGPLAAVGLGLMGGIVAVVAATALGRRRHAYASLFLGLWYAFVFNAYKDGDVLLNAAAELKRWVYVAVLVAGASILDAWRVRNV